MSALSAPRTQHAPSYQPIPKILSFPVKDGVIIYAGALVCLDAGYAKPATAAASLQAVGRAVDTIDNRSTVTGHADGFVNVTVETGVSRWDIKSGDEVVAADVGGLCYFTDDHTVQHTSTSNSIAGRVLAVTSTYADVLTYPGVQ